MSRYSRDLGYKTAVIVYRWVQEERRRLYKVNKNTRNKFTSFLNLKCLFRLYNNFSMVFTMVYMGLFFVLLRWKPFNEYNEFTFDQLLPAK